MQSSSWLFPMLILLHRVLPVLKALTACWKSPEPEQQSNESRENSYWSFPLLKMSLVSFQPLSCRSTLSLIRVWQLRNSGPCMVLIRPPTLNFALVWTMSSGPSPSEVPWTAPCWRRHSSRRLSDSLFFDLFSTSTGSKSFAEQPKV